MQKRRLRFEALELRAVLSGNGVELEAPPADVPLGPPADVPPVDSTDTPPVTVPNGPPEGVPPGPPDGRPVGPPDDRPPLNLALFAKLKESFGGPGNRGHGDLDGDGQIGLADFNLLKMGFGRGKAKVAAEASPPNSPENPGTVVEVPSHAVDNSQALSPLDD